jgi:hypothetical protein
MTEQEYRYRYNAKMRGDLIAERGPCLDGPCGLHHGHELPHQNGCLIWQSWRESPGSWRYGSVNDLPAPASRELPTHLL